MSNPRAITLTLIALTLAASAAVARPYNDKPSSLRIHFGELQLDGDSIYWQTRAEDFFGGVGDFDDGVVGVDFLRMVRERWGVLLSARGFESQSTRGFRDFVDELGNDIEHTASLEVTNVSAGLVLYLLRRGAILSPYIGGGASVYSYDLEEAGDFIDFDTFDIFDGTFRASGETIGTFWLVGIEVPVTSNFSIFGEARWHDASDRLAEDFQDFGDIDLSGKEASLGLSYRF